MKKRDEDLSETSLSKLTPEVRPYSKYNDVLTELSRELLSNIIELIDRAEAAAPKLRDFLPIIPLNAEATSSRVAAVDSGSSGKDLLVGYQPLSLAVGAVFNGGLRISEPLLATLRPPRSDLDEEEGVKLSSLIGYYLMYNLASILLSKSDIVLIDGPLYLPKSYYAPRGRSYSSSYLEVYEAALRSLSNLLREAKLTGKHVVGVVKRVRSHYISSWLGAESLPDSLLSSLLLREGEALGPLPASGGWEEVAPFLGDVRDFRPWAMFLRRGRSPIRIDLAEYSLDVAYALASQLYSFSEPSTGLPLPIVAVDRLSKLTSKQASLVYRMLLSGAKARGLSPERFALFSLQRGESD
ncbi:MAG: DNA double-strand break repair nuclease NurA [Candidatus Korarchaeum sp.]|nr:DNA double-strand break repair nuclease NurA [Candidatus Korarchaeum sp.]MDW8035241.1 DNA double-strand break repair nuclease NurA [Candidatus Korarchaeum sp.]